MLVGDATTERSESDRCCATDSPHGDTDSPHDEGGGDAGWGAANREVVGAIGKLLLMIPVDIEKLRNMAWERGGYQVPWVCAVQVKCEETLFVRSVLRKDSAAVIVNHLVETKSIESSH